MSVPGCPRHPTEFSRSCVDVRCQQNWSPEGAPTPEEQLLRWLAGDATCPNTRHECCPDFACCVGKGWDLEKRTKFVAADQGTREKMMMGALGALVDETIDKKVKVHVTRGEPTDHE